MQYLKNSDISNLLFLLTAGKLCLHNEELTKQSVVQMAQELETTPHQTIRNNLIIILCDLTVRYSAKVDPYIDTISACLKDPSLVRIN